MRRERDAPRRDGARVQERPPERLERLVRARVEPAEELRAFERRRRRLHRRGAEVEDEEAVDVRILRVARRQEERQTRPRPEPNPVDDLRPRLAAVLVLDRADGEGFHLRGVPSVGDDGDDQAALGGRPRDDGGASSVGRSHRRAPHLLRDRDRGRGRVDRRRGADEELSGVDVFAGGDVREVPEGAIVLAVHPEEIAHLLVRVLVAEGLRAERRGGVQGEAARVEGGVEEVARLEQVDLPARASREDGLVGAEGDVREVRHRHAREVVGGDDLLARELPRERFRHLGEARGGDRAQARGVREARQAVRARDRDERRVPGRGRGLSGDVGIGKPNGAE